MAEALRSETLPELPDARIEEDFAELHGAIEVFEAERLRRLADIGRRGLYSRDRVLLVSFSLVPWLKVAWGGFRVQARPGRALDEKSRARIALLGGARSMLA